MKKKTRTAFLLCAALATGSFASEKLNTVFDWNFTPAEGWKGNSWQEVAQAGFLPLNVQQPTRNIQ